MYGNCESSPEGIMNIQSADRCHTQVLKDNSLQQHSAGTENIGARNGVYVVFGLFL